MSKTTAMKEKWNAYWLRNKKSEGYLFKRDAMNFGIKICRFRADH